MVLMGGIGDQPVLSPSAPYYERVILIKYSWDILLSPSSTQDMAKNTGHWLLSAYLILRWKFQARREKLRMSGTAITTWCLLVERSCHPERRRPEDRGLKSGLRYTWNIFITSYFCLLAFIMSFNSKPHTLDFQKECLLVVLFFSS